MIGDTLTAPMVRISDESYPKDSDMLIQYNYAKSFFSLLVT